MLNTFLQQMAVAARNAEGYGWLCPALGVMELSQNIVQVGYIFNQLVFNLQGKFVFIPHGVINECILLSDPGTIESVFFISYKHVLLSRAYH